MSAFSTSAEWGFPDDLPGGWVQVDKDADEHVKQESKREPTPTSTPTPPPQPQPQPERKRKRHYPPRQCRICLETILPTFHQDTTTAADPSVPSLPIPGIFTSTPNPEPIRVTYESPIGEGGRLLRPCHCRGTQQYVHEECLRAWRFQNPHEKRNYWQCPTCSYKYRLQRLAWSSWISSRLAQVALTLGILLLMVAILGFVADPIINLYLDPVETIATRGGPTGSLVYEDEDAGWGEHFVKGLASLGLLGFGKFLLTLSPWHWFNLRTGPFSGGGHRGGGTGGTGRERLAQISWVTVVIGVVTVLWAVWRGVRSWSRKMLERAGERVMDVDGKEEDEDEEVDDEDTKEEQQETQQ